MVDETSVPQQVIVPLTPLELPGWLEFNVWRTGLKAHRFSATSQGGPPIRAVFYLDRRGRVRRPANNDYLPVVFRSARSRPSGRTAEWLRAAVPLVEEMKQRGVANRVVLPPDVDDVRPWQWRDFVVGVAYTYCLDFPFDSTLMDRTQRQHGERAAARGMTVERVSDVGPVIECLTDTEARKGFSLGINGRELQIAHGLLGSDNLRMYVAFDPDGRPASFCVILHAPDARALGWLAGTKSAHLTDGAGNVVWRFALADLASAGAAGIDLDGANMASIAEFKSRWGSRLVPTYTVRTHTGYERATLLPHGLYRRMRGAAARVRRHDVG